MLVGSRKAFNRFTLLSIGASVAILGMFLYVRTSNPQINVPTTAESHSSHHPIDTLIKDAEGEWKELLKKETHDVETAAQEYRERRGRHPPPGFAEWFEYAKSRDAIIVEDFFDQIHHDLNPYWGIEAQTLRKQARTFEHRVTVRGHKATFETDKQRVWMDSWHDLVQSIEEYLPDVDMPINVMDESRLIVPWETLAEYVHKEQSTRQLQEPENVVSEFTGLAALDEEPVEEFDPGYLGPGSSHFWKMVREGCPDGSAARDLEPFDFTKETPSPDLPTRLNSTYYGYVSNWTETKDPCLRPELQQLHGSFIEPISISTSHKLFPIFGGSKLTMNNEILIPPAMYWADDVRYSGGDTHGGLWSHKKDKLYWRGGATGGRNKLENWAGFQRHRFVSMVNGTAVKLAETDDPGAHPNFALPDYRTYQLAADRHSQLGEFIGDHSDAAFVHLICHPIEPDDDKRCSYTNHYFETKAGMPMKQQYAYKFLPDVDGNSFSGRYLGFLLSSSLPIKATVYNEWHDSRLVPWAHFVPMDSTFLDIYGIMEYFLGFEEAEGHDSAAEKIALDGQDWASKVLRHEDMQIYVYRLLLEYARLCDDKRDVLGYVDDLISA
ncbi:hypothetical protein FQN54_004985 [Arachnomyces sp. PD_36]|nr:hypothetical protein FQN54_004985 [Arachnomyces sp. PD_36]